MLCPTCQMAYGETVEGPWVCCEHEGKPSIARPTAGIFQMLWNPVRTLDYLRIYPLLISSLLIFILFTFVQTSMAAFHRHTNAGFVDIGYQWLWHQTNITNPHTKGWVVLLFKFFFALLTAGLLDMTAGLLNGRGRFRSLLSATLFIKAMVGWSIFIPWKGLMVNIPIVLLENAFLILAVSRLYAIHLAPAFWARVLAGLIQGGLFILCGLILSTTNLIRLRGSLFSPGRATLEKVNITPDLRWTVEDMDGKSFSMEQLRGQVTVVNVWATWCPPCRQELPSLEKLSNAFQGSSVHVMEISEESPKVVSAFLKRYPYHLSFYVRSTGLPSEFQTEAIPATYILNKEGHIVERKIGSARWDDPQVIDYLRKLDTK